MITKNSFTDFLKFTKEKGLISVILLPVFYIFYFITLIFEQPIISFLFFPPILINFLIDRTFLISGWYDKFYSMGWDESKIFGNFILPLDIVLEIIYIYLISCLIIFAKNKFRQNKSKELLALI